MIVTGMKNKMALLKCGFTMPSTSSRYRSIIRRAGRVKQKYYMCWLFIIKSLSLFIPMSTTARVKKELQMKEQAKMKKQIDNLANKVKSFTRHKESIRKMRRDLCEAELQLKEERVERRRAEDRSVLGIISCPLYMFVIYNVYNVWVRNVCASREHKSRNSYRQMAASKVEAESKMKSTRKKLVVAQKKLKSFTDREDSLRDMSRQVLEAEFKLKEERAERRRAEDRYVLGTISLLTHTH